MPKDDIILRFKDGIEVSNLDEVKAHLTNELNRVMKPLIISLNQIILATKANKPLNKVSVENQVTIPEEVKVNNFDELKTELSGILEAIKSLPAPEVTVNPQAVNVPAPIVNIPEIKIPDTSENLAKILKELTLGLNKLRTNTPERPLIVKLRKEEDILHTLQKILETGTKGGSVQAVGFSGGASQLTDLHGTRISPATVDSSDTSKGALTNQSAVNVTSTETQVSLSANKRSMVIQNTGTKIIYIGGTGVSSSSYAFKIVPMQIIDFGKVKTDFNFYAVCNGSDTSTLGVGEYA